MPSVEAARRAARTRPPIRLVYIRPEHDGETELDIRLRDVAERYTPLVALEIKTPASAGRLKRWTAPGSPAVVVMRRGVVVGQAIGHDLPIRELDRAIRRAVDWSRPH